MMQNDNLEQNSVVTTQEQPIVKPKLFFSDKTYDADTPTIIDEHGKYYTNRIGNTDGTEIGSGRDAETFRDFVRPLFGGEEVNITEELGTDRFGRRLDRISVGGVDYDHFLLEIGVSNYWTKYGRTESFKEIGKWYSGDSQAGNLEAFDLLASGVNPSDIIADDVYAAIQARRSKVKQHLKDSKEGVLDVKLAKKDTKELFSRPNLLALANKRDWYERVQGTTMAENMKLMRNNPAIWIDMQENFEQPALDSVTYKAEDSLGAWAVNAIEQQFHRGLVNLRSGMAKYKSEPTMEDFGEYVAKNNIPLDMANEGIEAFNEKGYWHAVETMNSSKILREDHSMKEQLGDPFESWGNFANTIVNGMLPYVVDPVGIVAGGTAGKLANTAVSGLASSIATNWFLKPAVVGGATGLAESLVYTTNNVKDFTNEELVKTWSTDTAFGAGAGVILGGLVRGLDNFGASSKADIYKEHILDSDYKAKVEDVATRQEELNNEVVQEINTTTPPPIKASIPVPEQLPLKLEQPEPTVSVTGEKVEPPELTPEQIEVQAEKIQTENVAKALEFQANTVVPMLKNALDSMNVPSKVNRFWTKTIGLRSFADKLTFNEDPKMSFIGTNILENPAGYAGNVEYKPTASLIADSHYTKTYSNEMASYSKVFDEWLLKEKGANYLSRYKNTAEGSARNDLAKEFNQALVLRQEAKHMGDTVEPNDLLDSYLNTMNKHNDELFNRNIETNVKGFDKERRIKSYFSHVWRKGYVDNVVRSGKKDQLKQLIQKSVESAIKKGKIADTQDIAELVERQMLWISNIGKALENGTNKGGVSARSKSRVPLDFTVEHNGMKMIDLISTDIPTVRSTYIKRSTADAAIAESTNGLIRSEEDFIKYLTPDKAEDMPLFQDTMDMMYGRPTRGGLAPELNNVQQFAVATQMGGIGVAQLAETGTMSVSLVRHTMSRPKVAKHILSMMNPDKPESKVLREFNSINAINDNLKYINRTSVTTLDQAQIEEISNIRAASVKLVDKLTLGDFKPAISKGLGDLTGLNSVQRAQSEATHAQFIMDLALAYKSGDSKMSDARLKDLGIPRDGDLADSFRTHVEYDSEGFPIDLHLDKWDSKMVNKLMYASHKHEAQVVPRVLVGELPTFMNHPLAAFLLLYKKTPLAFQQKGLQRNLQLADLDAAVSIVLNAMTAGLVRYTKVALGLGALAAVSGSEFESPDLVEDFAKASPYNYMSSVGINADLYAIANTLMKTVEEETWIDKAKQAARLTPPTSLISNAMMAANGDPLAAKSITIYNTLPIVNELSTAIILEANK